MLESGAGSSFLLPSFGLRRCTEGEHVHDMDTECGVQSGDFLKVSSAGPGLLMT